MNSLHRETLAMVRYEDEQQHLLACITPTQQHILITHNAHAQILVYTSRTRTGAIFHVKNVKVICSSVLPTGCRHSPVEFGSLHQSIRVSITDKRSAAQTGEAFWVILLFTGDLEHTNTEIRDGSALHHRSVLVLRVKDLLQHY